MKTVQIDAAQFRARIARFAELQPTVEEYTKRTGVDADAYRFTAARDIFYLFGAANPDVEAATRPAVEGPRGASMYIVGSPPGDGPALHAHMRTWETFLVLSGRWRFEAGDHGQYSAVLGPMDMFSCPPGVSRRFENVSEAHAHLMVIVQGDAEALDDIALATDIGDEIAGRWGEAARAGLERIGMTFAVERQAATETIEL